MFLMPANAPPHIHAIFDGLAWLAALAVRFLQIRLGNFAGVTMSPELGLRYKIVLLLGASIGALVSGTFNLMMQYPNAVGHSVLGAIIGGILSIEYFKWRHKIAGSTGVVWVLPLAVGIAVGRLGCFLAGLPDYTYGTPTALPWGVDFGDGVARHPVQLYEAGAMLFFAILAAPLVFCKNQWFRTYGFYCFAAYYAGQRFMWEFLKPYAKLVGPFNMFHILCGLLMGYALFMFYKRKAV